MRISYVGFEAIEILNELGGPRGFHINNGLKVKIYSQILKNVPIENEEIARFDPSLKMPHFFSPERG